jgi:hypothetical protein
MPKWIIILMLFCLISTNINGQKQYLENDKQWNLGLEYSIQYSKSVLNWYNGYQFFSSTKIDARYKRLYFGMGVLSTSAIPTIKNNPYSVIGPDLSIGYIIPRLFPSKKPYNKYENRNKFIFFIRYQQIKYTYFTGATLQRGYDFYNMHKEYLPVAKVNSTNIHASLYYEIFLNDRILFFTTVGAGIVHHEYELSQSILQFNYSIPKEVLFSPSLNVGFKTFIFKKHKTQKDP